MDIEKRNLKIKEFVKIYNICRTKVYQEINAGRLKVFKCGKSTLISKEAAEEWQSLLSQVEKFGPENEAEHG